MNDATTNLLDLTRDRLNAVERALRVTDPESDEAADLLHWLEQANVALGSALAPAPTFPEDEGQLFALGCGRPIAEGEGCDCAECVAFDEDMGDDPTHVAFFGDAGHGIEFTLRGEFTVGRDGQRGNFFPVGGERYRRLVLQADGQTWMDEDSGHDVSIEEA